MAKNRRLSIAFDQHGEVLIRKAAKKTRVTVSEYIRETVLREAADDIQTKERER